MVYIISIEGNIGAGKSTILDEIAKLGKEVSLLTVREPLDQYTKFKSLSGDEFNPLYELYSSPKENAQAAQEHFTRVSFKYFDSQYGLAKKTDAVRFLFSERTSSSTKQFLMLYYKLNYLSPFQKETLLKRYFRYRKQQVNYVDAYIYLRISPTICMERIQARAREGEDKIDLHLLKKLDTIIRSENDQRLESFQRAPHSSPAVISITMQKDCSPKDIARRIVDEITLHFNEAEKRSESKFLQQQQCARGEEVSISNTP